METSKQSEQQATKFKRGNSMGRFKSSAFRKLALLTLCVMMTVWPLILVGGLGAVEAAKIQPRDVVGNGTAASCTETSFAAAVANGGNIIFNCGSNPVTINITSEKAVKKDTLIDGGGKITLDGGNSSRIFNIGDASIDTGYNFTLQNLTLAHGFVTGYLTSSSSGTAEPGPAQGGAIYSYKGTITLISCTFTGNRAVGLNSQVGGGEAQGGLIYTKQSLLNIVNSTFTGNQALGGTDQSGYGSVNPNGRAYGGVILADGNLTITGSTFSNNGAVGGQGGANNQNSAISGGSGGYASGGVIYYFGSLQVSNSAFTGNQAVGGDGGAQNNSTGDGGDGGSVEGGAIDDGSAINTTSNITNSSFVNNQAIGGKGAKGVGTGRGGVGGSADGGAIQRFQSNDLMNITTSTFSHNSAKSGDAGVFGDGVSIQNGSEASGGAVHNDNTSLTIANSTFDSNTATQGNGNPNSTGFGGEGGGLYTYRAGYQNRNVNLVNNTFSGNAASGNAMSQSGGGNIAADGTLTIANTIFTNAPTGGNCFAPFSATINDGGGNLQYPDNTCGNNITIADPMLGPLANNGGPTQTFALQAGSAAIDFGNDSVCAADPINNKDQRGATRPYGAHCDSGAFEYGATAPAPTPAPTTPTPPFVTTPPVGTTTTTPVGSSYTYNLPLLANAANTALGNTTTFITFQNLSGSTANISVQYYNIQNGNSLNLHDTLQLPAKGQKAILPAIGPSGSSAGGVVSSDQPLNLVVSEGLNSGGSAYNVGASTASTLYSPLALNGQYGFTTSIIVFNGAGSGTATGQILFFDDTGSAVSGATQSFNIAAHASQTFNQATNNSGLTAGHAYWAKIVADNSSATLSAQVIEFGPANFVATFNAIVPSQVQKTLYAPATFNGQFNFVTGMAIANPNGTTANLSITYYNAAGTQRLQTSKTLAANGVVGVFQPGEAGLPTDVTSATISSDQPLIMTVNERGPGTISGTYVGLAGGSTKVALPVMAKGFAGFITGATILNAGNQPATLSFSYVGADGNPVGNAQVKTLAPNASFLVYQGDAAQNLPNGFFGTALITSNQPLLVTTNALNTNSGLFYTYTEPSN